MIWQDFFSLLISHILSSFFYVFLSLIYPDKIYLLIHFLIVQVQIKDNNNYKLYFYQHDTNTNKIIGVCSVLWHQIPRQQV